MIRLLALAAIAVTAAALPLPLAGANASSIAVCRASTVHYEAVNGTPSGVARVPWIASSNSAFRGYLFYWGGTRWSDTRPQTARILTTRARTNVHPKVLWLALRHSGSTLTIHGTRLDGPGSFRARYPAAVGGKQFPTYVDVPAVGCWRVVLDTGTLHGSVTFSATDG